MGLYVGEEYYSIMNPKKMKINLEEEEVENMTGIVRDIDIC